MSARPRGRSAAGGVRPPAPLRRTPAGARGRRRGAGPAAASLVKNAGPRAGPQGRRRAPPHRRPARGRARRAPPRGAALHTAATGRRAQGRAPAGTRARIQRPRARRPASALAEEFQSSLGAAPKGGAGPAAAAPRRRGRGARLWAAAAAARRRAARSELAGGDNLGGGLPVLDGCGAGDDRGEGGTTSDGRPSTRGPLVDGHTPLATTPRPAPRLSLAPLPASSRARSNSRSNPRSNAHPCPRRCRA